MAGITAADIKDQKSFQAWIEARPEAVREETAISLAHRASMRVAPFLSRRGKQDSGLYATVLCHALRANVTSRMKVTFRSAEMDFANGAAARSVAVAARSFDTNVAMAAYVASPLALGASHFATMATYTFHDTPSYSMESMWSEIQYDASCFENGKSSFETIAKPLWRKAPEWWDAEFGYFFSVLTSTEMASYGFTCWANWYKAAAFGNPIFGIRSETIRSTLERNIALGSTDGIFDEQFWEQPIHDINTDIKYWVEEAQAADVLEAKLRTGLLLEFFSKHIRIHRGKGLETPGNDRKAINDQLVLLRQMVERLSEKFSRSDTSIPDDLQFALNQLKWVITKNALSSIGIPELYTASSSFRAQVNAAKSPAPGVNIFPLDGPNLALCESVSMTADMIFLATEEGRQQIERADTAERDAGPDEQRNELEIRLFNLVAENGHLMEKEDVELIRLFLRSEQHSPHPLRLALFKRELVHNAIYTMLVGGVAIGVAAATLPVVASSTGIGIIGAALLVLFGNESIKQSEYFKNGTKWSAEKINETARLLQQSVSGDVPPQLRKFVLQNKDLIRQIAGKRKSGETLLTLLSYIERQEQESEKRSDSAGPSKD